MPPKQGLLYVAVVACKYLVHRGHGPYGRKLTKFTKSCACVVAQNKTELCVSLLNVAAGVRIKNRLGFALLKLRIRFITWTVSGDAASWFETCQV